MIALNSLLVHDNIVRALLLDMDENVRAALLCWAIVLSAFVVLRIPREVLLGCLVAAAATVGLAITVVDLTPERAIASAVKPVPVARAIAPPWR